MDLKEIEYEIVDRICMSQDRGFWRALLNTIMKHGVV
jgi:hypothetical protein